jgi:hypothetical protein
MLKPLQIFNLIKSFTVAINIAYITMGLVVINMQHFDWVYRQFQCLIGLAMLGLFQYKMLAIV